MIRLSKKEDIKSLVDISISFWNEDPNFKQSYFEKKNQKQELFLKIKDSKILGYIVCIKDYWEGCDFIDEIGVNPNFRREGIASELIQHIIEISKQNKKRRLFSSLGNENLASIKLHLKNGFVVCGQINHMFSENETELILSILL